MRATNDGQVIEWLRAFERGEDSAAQHLWNRYFSQIQAVASAKTKQLPGNEVEAEDIAVSVFESLWRAANEGRLAQIQNRNALWGLILTITKQKLANHVRRATAQKRGNGHIPTSLAEASGCEPAEDPAAPQANPVAETMFREEYERLLGLLRDDRLREIAVLKLSGWTSIQLSKELKISTATVTRKLRLIRETWGRELG